MKRLVLFLSVVGIGVSLGQEFDAWRMGLVSNPQYPYCSDVWGYTDENGHDFAVFGVIDGTVILDVSTNPSDPVETGHITGAFSAWRDLKTHGDVLYVTNQAGGGLDIIDLTDPWNPSLANRYTGFRSAHNLFIADGYAYIVGSDKGSGGIRILDLSDPFNPQEAGSWETTYIHDIYVKNDTAYACAIGEGDLYILDVSDKEDIQTFTILDYGDYGTHAVWTTEDSKFIITSDETFGGHAKIWDARDFSHITLASEYSLAQNRSIHNVFVKGDKLFVSYYVFGTRVVDISDPYNPVEVAYFDLYPGGDGFYDGNWGTYPFTRSGLIYSTSMSGDGLFILQYPLFVEFDHEPLRDTEDMAGPYEVSAAIQAVEENELVPATAMAVSGLNGEFTDTTYLTPGTAPGEFNGFLPGRNTAGQMTYYLAVQDTAGRWSTEPYGAPASHYAFNVGPDLIPPEIVSMTTLENSVYFSGSQGISCEVDDNIGVLEVRLIWTKNGTETDSLNLTAGEDSRHYSGTFAWSGDRKGDAYAYFLRVVDDSQNRNVVDSDTLSFEIASHVTIGKFEEKDLTAWDTGDSWGSIAIGGDAGWGVNDSPGEHYLNNADNLLTLLAPLDLTEFDEAYVRFYTIYALETDADFGYVEVSADGSHWDTLKTVTGVWLNEDVVLSLQDYLGESQVHVRLRMTSNESVTYLGWSVDDIEFWVNESPLKAEPGAAGIPEKIALLPNYPNPFNPSTTIVYELPSRADIALTIYDLLGRKIATLAGGRMDAGVHRIRWDASDVASGVYLYQLSVRRDGVLQHVLTRKMSVVK
ncbi:MAG: choice-of-anchor B family protein [Fidelibacterota bacterium]